MRFRGYLGGYALLTVLGISVALAAGCRITRYQSVPVTMKAMRPMVWAKINGAKARFIIDTGSFWDMISPEARTEYHLSDSAAVVGLWIQGINGSSNVQVTTIRTFTFLHVPFRSAEFLVEGNDFPSGAAGALGGRLLHLADVEYDFADGFMRFIGVKGCKGVPLAYWAGHRSIGAVKLEPMTATRPFLIGRASVNGHVMRVLFDSGSPRSMLSLRAARRAGIGLNSPGVRPVGRIDGIGKNWIKTWIAPLATFEIGDEKIEHSHVLVTQFNLHRLHVGMILGADFFLSHHIVVANRRDMLYFTYNGGPVFALGKRYKIQRGSGAAVEAGPGTKATADDSHGSASAEMRRGMALAAEGQYKRAFMYMNRACRLAPHNARYRFRRAHVYWAENKPAKALADFDAAIKLNPKFYEAHLSRAILLLDWKHAPAGSRIEAKADINIVSLLAPDASVLRLRVATLYARIGQYGDAVRTVKLWMYYHRNDALAPTGWNTLCWVRAEGNIQLHKALRDCTRALKEKLDSASVLDSRGLVYIRLGRWAQAIRSYDAALHIRPHLAASLYGRAVAERHEGKHARARADLAAALKVNPHVEQFFARIHLGWSTV